MTTLSSFRINQPPGTPYAEWDRARKDLEIASVECEAFEKAQGAYKWELISLPSGVSVTINNGTTHTCNFTLATTGGYLIQLTVNEGDPNESITSLYIGVALEGSGLVIPALSETNQDNSESPYDGWRGTEAKSNDFRRAVDQSVFSPTKTVTTSSLNYADAGRLLQTLVSGQELTLPAPKVGIIFRVQGVNSTVNVLPPGGEDIAGPWLLTGGWTRWTNMVCSKSSIIVLQSLKNDSGDYEWWVVGGNGSVVNADDGNEVWFFGTDYVDKLRTNIDQPPGRVLGTNQTNGGPFLQWIPMTGFSQILDPVAHTLVLTPVQSGALVMTTNSTGGKSDVHDVHLPTPEHGSVFTVQHSFGSPGSGNMTVEVDNSGTELIFIGGMYNESSANTPWEGTKIGLEDSSIVQFFGVSSTKWVCVILGGNLTLDPDTEGDERENSYGQLVYSRGSGDSINGTLMVRGKSNSTFEAGGEGIMFGEYCQMLSHYAQTYGQFARARQRWTSAKVTGLSMDDVPGRCQGVTGMVLGAKTSDDSTWVRLANNPGSSSPLLEGAMVLAFRGLLVVKAEASETMAKAWSFDGCIRVESDGSANFENSTIVVISETSIGNESVWDVRLGVGADVSGSFLDFEVRGSVGLPLVWTMTMETAEIQKYEVS